MWSQLFLQPGLGFWMGDKASRKELEEVENALSVKLPRILHSFLAEINGCAINLAGLEIPDSDNQTVKMVWSCREIIAQNRTLREQQTHAGNGFMAHRDMLWIVMQPDGALAGLRVTAAGDSDSTVFLYRPGYPSEPHPQSVSLRQYLSDRLSLYQREYGRDLWE